MRKTVAHFLRCLAADLHGLKEDVKGAIPIDAGFPFSAWFFVSVVAFTFLDAYVLRGKGVESYFSVPTDMLVNSRGLLAN